MIINENIEHVTIKDNNTVVVRSNGNDIFQIMIDRESGSGFTEIEFKDGTKQVFVNHTVEVTYKPEREIEK